MSYRMVDQLVLRVIIATGLSVLFATQLLRGQMVADSVPARIARNNHFLLNAHQPPGFVAHAQISGRRPGVGTFTAVSLMGPEELQIGLAQAGQFLPPIEAPVTTGMLVGAVYRFRVTHIPDRPGEELYPTLEIIDRTYPEPGKEHRFPIPIVMTQEDLILALQGGMVTRVIYLEDAELARPVATGPSEQFSLDVPAHANALRTADELGRPVAILRIGSRVPSDLTGDLSSFLYGCPPWVPMPVAPDRARLIQEGRMAEVIPVERASSIYSENPDQDFPRTPSNPTGGGGLPDSYLGDQCSPCLVGSTNHEIRRVNSQEYLFDGGDREPSTNVREDWSAIGIDPTDTVAYYETAGGKVCVRPTNRLAIYAPRFGAVRQVTGAVFAESTLAPGRMLAPQSTGGIEDIHRATGLDLTAGPITQKRIQQLDRFREDRPAIPLTKVVPPTPVSDAVAALINVDISATDLAAVRETAVQDTSTAFVRSFLNPESLTVMIGAQSASIAVGTRQASEVLLYETPDRCALRITKTVSQTMAKPGDILRFTLRFENVGPNKVGNVVIVDSLSPRLGYIEGSQQCSIEVRFSADPNDAGSAKLRWELESPIKPFDGGVISFDCQVR